MNNHKCVKQVKKSGSLAINQLFGGKNVKKEEKALLEEAQMICIALDLRPLSFPKLKKLAQKILSIQASSVASESAFSTQGNIQTNERTRLTSEHVKQLLFLHYFYLDKYKTDKCPSKKK